MKNNMKLNSIVYLFLFIIFINYANCQDPTPEDDATHQEEEPNDYITRTKENLFHTMFQNYSNRVRPCGAGKGKNMDDRCGPVEVKVFVYLRTVDSVNDKDMNFDMQLLFRQTWEDPRLKYSQHLTEGYNPTWLTLTAEEEKYKVWIPDTFFVNEKKGFRHSLDKDNVMIRIRPNGNVVYSFRVTVTLDCNMDFRYYPKDIHRCMADMSSYAHTVQHIVYKWKESNAVLMSRDFKRNVAKYELERIRQEECPIVTSTGKYSCVRLNVQIRRIFNFAQFGHLFLPSFALVCISWLTFWLGTDAIVARVMVALFCLLTVIIQTTMVASNFPPAETIRAIDVWITICLAFLVAVLLQLVVIYRITRSEKRKSDSNKTIEYIPVVTMEMAPLDSHRKKTIKHERLISQSGQSQQAIPLVSPAKKLSIDNKIEDGLPRVKKDNPVVRKWQRCSKSQKFDVICRAIFPIAFFLVNISYWFSFPTAGHN